MFHLSSKQLLQFCPTGVELEIYISAGVSVLLWPTIFLNDRVVVPHVAEFHHLSKVPPLDNDAFCRAEYVWAVILKQHCKWMKVCVWVHHLYSVRDVFNFIKMASLTPLSNQWCFLERIWTSLSSKECSFVFQVEVEGWLWSTGIGPPALAHVFMEWWLSFTNVQVITSLTTLNHIAQFVSGCFALWVDQSLPQSVPWFEVDRNVVVVEDPFEFLR